MTLIDAPSDPTTTRQWSELAYASVGTLRNWCRTDGVPTRRSLLLGRLLRASRMNGRGELRLCDALNIIDVRTLARILRLASINERCFPQDVNTMLATQQLVTNPIPLLELSRAFEQGVPRPVGEKGAT